MVRDRTPDFKAGSILPRAPYPKEWGRAALLRRPGGGLRFLGALPEAFSSILWIFTPVSRTLDRATVSMRNDL